MLFDDHEDDDFFPDDELESAAVSQEPDQILSARQTSKLIGHEDIETRLVQMFNTGRFPHGVIFSGPAGVGKSVMAYRLARFLFAQDAQAGESLGLFGDAPEPPKTLAISISHEAHAKVASGGHMDLMTVERPFDEKTGRFKGSVPVDEIRKIAPFLRRTSSIDGGWRVVIIDDADTMTRSSQNSLLKILEEPPARTVLILIAHRAGALLPTLYSRCVHVPFFPLPDADIRAALTGRVSADFLPQLVAMAEGSLGTAYDLALPEHEELIETSLMYLKAAPKFDWVALQAFAEQFGSKGNDDAQRVFRDLMLWVSGALVRGKLTGFDGLQSLSLEQKLKIHDTLKDHFDRVQMGNLDKRFLLMGAFMAFEG